MLYAILVWMLGGIVLLGIIFVGFEVFKLNNKGEGTGGGEDSDQAPPASNGGASVHPAPGEDHSSRRLP